MGGNESKARTHWQPDSATAKCGGCNSPFGLAKRRHHCRSCGYVFCDECTRWRAYDPQFMAEGSSDRVCKPCYDVLTGAASQRIAPRGGSGGADGRGNNGNGAINGKGRGGAGAGSANMMDENGAAVVSGRALQEPAAPSRRGPIIVTDTNNNPNESSDSPDDDAVPAPTGQLLYEAAMDKANRYFVDVKSLVVKAGGGLRMSDRDMETALIAVGGTTQYSFSANPVWSPHTLPSIDASATLFAVARDVPASLWSAHKALARAAGVSVPNETPSASSPGGDTDGIGGGNPLSLSEDANNVAT